MYEGAHGPHRNFGHAFGFVHHTGDWPSGTIAYSRDLLPEYRTTNAEEAAIFGELRRKLKVTALPTFFSQYSTMPLLA